MDRRQSFYKWYCRRHITYKSCGREEPNMQLTGRDKEVSSFEKSLLPNDDGYASSRRGTKWLPEDPYPVIQLRLVQEGEEVIIENL